MPVSADDSVALPTGPHAPSLARAWVAERAGAVPAELLEDALLVTSELVTNAVRHGRPEIVLSLHLIPGGLRIAVRDSGAYIPRPRETRPGADRPSGRGLLIVEATARTWGITTEKAGKTVWAELVR